jgi:D-2-hydroxyacid dehydrogenase (NADP+)
MNLLLLLPRAENIDRIYDRELRARFPALRVDSVERHEDVGPLIANTDVLLTFSPFMADHVARDAVQLKWIQVLGSGVDGIVNLASLREDVMITNGRGVQATPVSECAMALMLSLSRDVSRLSANQAEKRWERWPAQVMHGRTLGILGVGQIAEQLAAKAKAFGMHVVGISSSQRAVPGFDRMYARAELAHAVRDLDYLVLLTPYSAQTHHIVNADVFANMKASAFLVNVARGGVLDETALIAALHAGQIRGAALDVFSQEPLPATSELWSLPNVLISPHLAGLNSSYPHSILPLVEQNIRLFLAGRRHEMINVVRAGA